MDKERLDPDYNTENYSAAVIILNNSEKIEVKSLSRQELFVGVDICFLLPRYGACVWHIGTHLAASAQSISLQTGLAVKKA